MKKQTQTNVYFHTPDCQS